MSESAAAWAGKMWAIAQKQKAHFLSAKYKKSKFWLFLSTSMYDLPTILFIFSKIVYLHLHQGQHLKYTLDNIFPVGKKKKLNILQLP